MHVSKLHVDNIKYHADAKLCVLDLSLICGASDANGVDVQEPRMYTLYVLAANACLSFGSVYAHFHPLFHISVNHDHRHITAQKEDL